MSYEHKLDKKFVDGPVDETCGNPGDRKGDGVTHGGVKFEGGPQHPESGGVIDTVTFDTDVDEGRNK